MIGIAGQMRRMVAVSAAAALLLLSGSSTIVAADVASTSAPASATTGQCAEVSLQSIRLGSRVSVDEIRVIVARHSPDSGAAKISVEAGRFGRVVRVMGNGSRGLKFTRPLKGHLFEVSLDPVFTAQRSACVEQILLLRAGHLVAAIKP